MPNTGNSGNVDFTASNQGGNQVLRVHWVETYDIATWTSTVAIDHVYFSTTSWTGYTYNASFEILINGQSALSITENDGYTCSSAGTALKEILKAGAALTGSVSGIPHNADGSKTTTISIRASTGGYSYPGLWTYYWDYSGLNAQMVGLPNKFTENDSKSITLYTIAAASTISTPDGQFGVAQNITISRQSSGVTHTLVATCLGQTQTIMTKAATYPTKSWTPPASWMDLIPNAQTAPCTITCTTYSGNTAVGTSSIAVTLSVTGVNPAPTVAYAEPSGQSHVSRYGHLVQGQSRVAVTVTPETKRSATVASLSAVVNGSTYYPASPYTFTTSPLTASGNNAITATVRDSRGLSGTGSATVSGVLAYNSPALSSIGVHRCNSDMTANDSGTYMYISYTASITALNNANAKKIAYRYQITGGSWSAWAEVTMSAYSQSGSLPASGTPIDISTGITNGAAYQVEVRLTDDFGSVVRSTSLSTTPVTMDWNEYGDAVGFGKAPAFRKAVDIGNWAAIGRVLGLGQARASIPANADLNDYAEPGVYGIVSNAIASTLTNRPSTNAGTLRVWNSFGDGKNAGSTWFGITQEYCDYFGYTWKRHGDSSSDPAIIWSAWVAQQNTSSSNYCKMPDGTLICWGETTYDLSGGAVMSGNGYWYVEKAQTIAFPVAFSSRPSVIVTKGRGTITVPGWVQWNNQGITEIDWIFWTSSPSLTSGPIACWQAIGRWK